jgi:hypothetical protein
LVAAISAGAGVWQTGGPPPGFEKIDQGSADVGPLNLDMRVQPYDLRNPMDYDAVYRALASDGHGGTSEYFARMSGAVTAVFPRSSYTPLPKGGISVDIPAGTVFYIGDLPDELTGGQGAQPTPILLRPPTPVRSTPDALAALPFDPEIERISAQRRADVAAELILKAASAEKARIHP